MGFGEEGDLFVQRPPFLGDESFPFHCFSRLLGRSMRPKRGGAGWFRGHVLVLRKPRGDFSIPLWPPRFNSTLVTGRFFNLLRGLSGRYRALERGDFWALGYQGEREGFCLLNPALRNPLVEFFAPAQVVNIVVRSRTLCSRYRPNFSFD